MAYYTTTHPASDSRLRRTFTALLAEFSAWREAVATRNALSRLTDAELSDIGLTRGDLDEMSNAELRNV